ncbi:MAG: ABC transporter permease subunit [Acidobacteriota bacterium]|nr:ABC transporter permease subunit [Acidobacteriota bacterium]
MTTPTELHDPGGARLRSIFGRALREERRALIGWAIGVVAFCLVMLSIFPTIHGNVNFSKLLDAYPEALRKMFQVEDYTTGPGYLRAEVFSFVAPLLLTLFAVLWGSDLTAGEEERRTIDLLLANPVSRRRFVGEKWLALIVGTAILAAALEIALGVIGPLFKLHVAWSSLTAEVLGSWLFAAAFGTLALSLGAATGRRGLARGITTTLALASYLLSTLSNLVSWLRPARNLSLWQHTLGVDPLGTGFHLDRIALVIAVTLVFAGGALWAFDRRDLAT